MRIFSHKNYGEMSDSELSGVLSEQWGCLVCQFGGSSSHPNRLTSLDLRIHADRVGSDALCPWRLAVKAPVLELNSTDTSARNR